jgi:tetratricopeptide (TPR) repeat protein
VGLFENGDVEQPDALRKRQQTVQDLLVGSAKALGQELKDQPQVRAELQGVLGRLLHNLALGDEAIAVRQQRVDQLQALHAPPAELAQAWRELADSQDMRGEVKAAGDSLRQGLALCRGAGMTPPAMCWGMQAALGWQDVLAGKLPPARGQIDPALAQLRRLAPGSAELAEALAFAGDARAFESGTLGRDGPGEVAYALQQESIHLRARLWGPQSVRLARNRFQLGMTLWMQGKLALASAELARAEQDMAQAMGPAHTDTLEIALQRGWLEVLMNLNPDAIKRVTQAAKSLMARASDIDPRTHLDAVTALGECLLYIGDMASALPHLERSLQLAHELEGSLVEAGRSETNMAWYLQDTGQFAAARKILSRALVRLRQNWGTDHALTQGLEDRIRDLDLVQAGQSASNVKSDDATTRMIRGKAEAAWRATQNGRRSDLYAMTVLTANAQMGQIEASQGHCDRALGHYEANIAALHNAHPDSPYLMLTRARMGQCLVSLHQIPRAQQMLHLANTRLAKAPRLGPHLVQEVRALKLAIEHSSR